MISQSIVPSLIKHFETLHSRTPTHFNRTHNWWFLWGGEKGCFDQAKKVIKWTGTTKGKCLAGETAAAGCHNKTESTSKFISERIMATLLKVAAECYFSRQLSSLQLTVCTQIFWKLLVWSTSLQPELQCWNYSKVNTVNYLTYVYQRPPELN